MKRRKIRFGIIGCGLMGREFASAAARWAHLLDVEVQPEIVAVCDANPQAMEWFTDQFKSVQQATADYRALLSNDLVEAVYCAVPHNLHEQIYLDILRGGKHMLAEKPFGIDLKAAESIVKEIESRPRQLVRVSSEFPFYPGPQRIAQYIDEKRFGKIIEVRAGFLHSSDLDPNKPINWKRRIATCGEYGCMGDLGLHVLHMPLRAGWKPKNVRALLSNIVEQRPDGSGATAQCETWDNALLACESEQGFPMLLETKRISPGDTNTWYIRVYGTEFSAEFSTRRPRTLRTLPYTSGETQAWREEDLGYSGAYRTITGGIFEFGFTDAILQMWASFCDELSGNTPRFRCATPEEALESHRLFTAALYSQKQAKVVGVT